MSFFQFYLRAAVYLFCFLAAWYGMSAVDYERILKKNHVRQAQLLYFMLIIGLAYLAGSFLLAIIYRG